MTFLHFFFFFLQCCGDFSTIFQLHKRRHATFGDHASKEILNHRKGQEIPAPREGKIKAFTVEPLLIWVG